MVFVDIFELISNVIWRVREGEMWNPKGIVTDRALENLKDYRYACIDDSICSRLFLQSYWRWAASWAPRWMAPNLITLLGFLCILINLPFLLLYLPNLNESSVPGWVYVSFALGIWVYSTMDNIDGKQARRTGTSSPLGELFDQCFGALFQAASVGMGKSWFTMGLLFLTTSVFYLTTWESYHTHVLYLGPLSGPSEGVLISVSIMLLSAVWGPGLWWMQIRDLIPLLGPFLQYWNIPSITLLEVTYYLMTTLSFSTQLPVCILRVYRVCKAQKSSFSEALFQLVPYGGMTLLTIAWLASPFATAAWSSMIVFFLGISILFGRVASLIILAHVTKTRFPSLYSLQIPIFIGTVLVYLPFLMPNLTLFFGQMESIYVYVLLLSSILSYGIWASIVIDRFCTHLGISCLTIPKSKWEKIE